MSIVQENVSILTGAAPSTRQQTGALISQGATSLASGTYSLLTQTSDLTPLLAPPQAIASLTWSGGVVTANTVNPIAGLTSGDTFLTTIAGAAPVGYNGVVTATVTGASSFTYPLANNPGTATSTGTYTPGNQYELLSLATTDFFAQGTSRAVYVLELGASDATTGPTALGTFITANPNFFYGYLVPKSWDGSANFIALAKQFNTDTSKTYFFTTTTTSTYAPYTNVKSIWAMVEAPTVGTTEFDTAEAFQAFLSYAPSATNQMTPFYATFLNDATLYPQQGNAGLLAALDTANVNYVASAAEGGLSNVMISSGAMMDGNDASYWYSVDNLQISADQKAAFVVIQGSNNKVNPLWYSQDGINRLQDAEVSLLKQSLASKLTTGTIVRTQLDQATFVQNLQNGVYAGQNVVNAVPFTTYLNLNPDDYDNETYKGITIAYIPARGFKHIVFSVLVTGFIPQS